MRQHLSALVRHLLVAVGAILVAVVTSSSSVMLLAVGGILAGMVVLAISVDKDGHGAGATHLANLAVLFSLAGTLVWRTRSADALASNPLDAAGLYRIACDGAAALLALMALRDTDRARTRRWPTSMVLYAGYVVVVTVGVVTAVKPTLVLFRAVELSVFVLVWMAGRARWGTPAQGLRLIVGFSWFLTATLALGVLLHPATALVPARGGLLPWRLEGAFPSLSADTVGTVGNILVIAGMMRLARPAPAITVGVALVALSQYRTGYVILAAAILLSFYGRRTIASRVAFLVACLLMAFLVQSGQFQQAWTRGEEPELVGSLNSRTTFWSAGLDVAERSRFVGTGLSSGTRFEVLDARLGRAYTSTIHGTWIEAYVGAGLLGTGLLAAAFACAVVSAARSVQAVGRAPLLFLGAILVRSVTGTTIELAGLMLALFFAAVLLLEEPSGGDKPSISQFDAALA